MIGTCGTKVVSASLPLCIAKLRIDASSWVSWFSFALAFLITISVNPDAAADIRSFGLRTHLLLLSVVLFFLAIVLIQWRMRLALKAQTFGQPRQLFSTGIFSLSRNPMYVCFLVPLAAWCLWSPLASGVSVIVYIVTMNIFVIRREEEILRMSFGTEFSDYARRVPRWLLPVAS